MKDYLRASEQRFRDLVEGSIQGILIHRDFVPIFVNRACAEILGYGTPQEVIATGSLDRLLAADECKRIRLFAADRLRGKAAPAQYELRARRKDGSLTWVELHPCLIEWDGQAAIQVSMIDIDGRKRAEMELREAQANLEKLVAERTRELAEEVAAHQRTEETLRDSEEKYRTLVDNMDDGVFLVKDGKLTFANRGMADLLGCTVDEMVGRPYPEFVAPACREKTIDLHGRRVAGDPVDSRYEVELLHRDGRAIAVLLNLTRIVTPQGEPAILGTAKDITERKRAEMTLRESEERFKALLDNSPQSLNLKDAEGRYLLVNTEWERQHAVSAADALGRTSVEVFGTETGERLAGVEGEVIVTGEPRTFETTVLMPNGQWQTRLITKFPVLDGKGQASRIGTVGIDITERKAVEEALCDSEERFRALLDNSPLFIHLKDTAGRYLMVNPEFERQHGLKARDVLGKTIRDLFPADSSTVIDAADRKTLETGETTVFEVNFQLPDGTVHTHLGTKFPIRDSSGTITRIGTFGMDITERKRMEKALCESEEQLRAILDHAPAAINLKDADGRYILVNRGFEQHHGLAPQDVLGKTADDFFSRESAAALKANEKEILATGESRAFELNVTLPKGTVQTHFITKFPIRDGNGAITRLGTISLDVSERKRAADALRDSEARFRALVDNAQAIITLKDRDGRYLMVNKEYERRVGVSADRVMGATARDFMPPEAADDIERLERLVRDSGKAVTAEVVTLHQEAGTPIIYHMVKFPILDARGQTVQIGTFSVDITERKRAEQALKASEEWFRDFAESTSDWLWESDADGRLTYVSDRISDLFGFEAAVLLGKRRDQFAAPGQEDKWHELEETTKAHQPIHGFRYEVRTKNGQSLWLRITGRPRFSPTGVFLGYRGTGTNITDEMQALRREAQVTERFLASIETVAVAIALFDGQDRLVIANQGYRSQFITSIDWLSGITFEEMLRAEADAGAYPESWGNKEEWIRERLKRHRNPSGSFEITKSNGLILQIREHRAPDGYTMSVAYDITASKTAEQALISARDELELRVRERTHALEQEIAERQYAEQALQEANIELERRVEERTHHLRDEIAERKKMEAQFIQAQKMEAVGQLAGGIAHDFNNLLTVIQGNLSWLNDVVKADAKTTRLMGMALEAARRAGQLTHRMLAFSRRQDLRPEAIDLRRTLEGMEPLIGRALSEAVKLQIDIVQDYWPLMIDAHQLESAILNIAINARDAMPSGGTFTLRVENRAVDPLQAARHDNMEPGEYVLLSMSDTGTGMPAEVLDRVFDPFFTTKEVGKGSGLGLSMVFGFVNQSGGFIEITSQPGEGTTVEIYLPRSAETAVDSVAVNRDQALALSPDITVLVVEDDPLVRGVAVEYLKMAAVGTLQASDGPAAVAILEKTETINVVLSDVIMPGGLSGLDLAEIVRRRWPQTAILFMSGYSYDEFARHGIDPDTIELLRKPFTKRELLQKIQDVVTTHEA